MIGLFNSYASSYFHLFKEINFSEKCSKIKEHYCEYDEIACTSNLCSNSEMKPSFILGGLSVFEYEKTLSKNHLEMLKYSNIWNSRLEGESLGKYSVGVSIDSGAILLLPLFASKYTLGITLIDRGFLTSLSNLLLTSIDVDKKEIGKKAIDHLAICIEEEKEIIELLQEYEKRKREFENFHLETVEKVNEKREQKGVEK